MATAEEASPPKASRLEVASLDSPRSSLPPLSPKDRWASLTRKPEQVRRFQKAVDFEKYWPRRSIPCGPPPEMYDAGLFIKKAEFFSYRVPLERPLPPPVLPSPVIDEEILTMREIKLAFYKKLKEEKQSALMLTYNVVKKRVKPLIKKAKPQLPKKVAPIPLTPLRFPVKKTPLEVVSVKDALRNKEWLGKARDQISRDLAAALTRSNGLVVPPLEAATYYKYFIGRGNNSTLVKQIFLSRWWWVRAPEDEPYSANLLWTQWKDSSFLATLPTKDLSLPAESSPPVATPSAGVSIVCTTKLAASSDTSIFREYKLVDISSLGLDLLTKPASYTTVEERYVNSSELKTHNRLEGNSHLANKKGLFYNLTAYYEALGLPSSMPLTFHITDEASFELFAQQYAELGAVHWIVKPGENSNRGNGITVCGSLEQIQQEIKAFKHTAIVQQYVEDPYLVHRRKFDIRCYALVTCINGVTQAYFYNEGYLRTSSKPFTLSNLANKFIHLTNDAIQQRGEDYGRFENGNKLSYVDFQRYLDTYDERSANFLRDILPKMKAIVKHTVEATFLKLNPGNKAYTFEILGYDFLLDSDLAPWLLEVNTNPCLELSAPLLARLIPAMLENSFRIAVDPLFPEPLTQRRTSTEPIPENKYELIFHSAVDGTRLLAELQARGSLAQVEAVHPALAELSDVEEDHPDELGEQPAAC